MLHNNPYSCLHADGSPVWLNDLKQVFTFNHLKTTIGATFTAKTFALYCEPEGNAQARKLMTLNIPIEQKKLIMAVYNARLDAKNKVSSK
jgi:hypothetical protein